MSSASSASSGAENMVSRVAPTMSKARLMAFDERDRPKRGTPSRGTPPRSSKATDEPTALSELGSRLTLRFSVVRQRDHDSVSLDRGRDTAQALRVPNDLIDSDHPNQLYIRAVAELGLETAVHRVARDE
jgi:hypothetical protein